MSTPYETLRARLIVVVNQLPSTDGVDVGNFLREKGVVGHMGTCSACPIANYIRAELGEHASWVHAGPEGLRAWYGPQNGDFVVINTPEPVAAFMKRFDRGLESRLHCRPDADGGCQCAPF